MHRRSAVLATAALLPLAAPAVAGAHVTLQPTTAPEGAYVVMDVRVPNERDDASTTKVDLQLPAGFSYAAYQAVPGWTAKVTKAKLATPVQTDDGPITEGVTRITWTGTGRGQGAIAPGQFRDFPLQVGVPGKAGDTLTFKALQTYSDGEVVRWIGAEGSETPAPTVRVVPAVDATTTTASAGSAPASASAAPVATASSADGGGGTSALSVVALVVGALGLLAGGAALVRTNRRGVGS